LKKIDGLIYLSHMEAAVILGIKRQTVYTWCRKGILPDKIIPKKWGNTIKNYHYILDSDARKLAKLREEEREARRRWAKEPRIKKSFS